MNNHQSPTNVEICLRMRPFSCMCVLQVTLRLLFYCWSGSDVFACCQKGMDYCLCWRNVLSECPSGLFCFAACLLSSAIVISQCIPCSHIHISIFQCVLLYMNYYNWVEIQHLRFWFKCRIHSDLTLKIICKFFYWLIWLWWYIFWQLSHNPTNSLLLGVVKSSSGGSNRRSSYVVLTMEVVDTPPLSIGSLLKRLWLDLTQAV